MNTLEIAVPALVYTDRVNEPNHPIFAGVYFHGDLLNKVGYDIVSISYEERAKINEIGEGRMPVVVRDIDGVDYFAVLYYWKSKSGLNRGYIVFAQDKTANQFAMQQLAKLAENL